MNNDFSKLRLKQEQQSESATSLQQGQQTQIGLEFASVEEMIRRDKEQMEVPEGVAERLNESLRQEPAPSKKSWWRKLLGE